jgi:dihydrofolate reductase
MRKVVPQLFYSVDGVVERPDKWAVFPDEDTGEEITAVIGRQDDVLLGRVTYEEWAGYWPNSKDEPFASFINNVRKHVASKSLKKTEWKNSQLLGADTAAAVRALKATSGGDIGVHGSIRLVQSLIKDGLVDELILYVMPRVAGQGLRRLFEPGEQKREMKLVRSRVAKNGIAILTYTFAGSGQN